jgi:hypothetical protein
MAGRSTSSSFVQVGGFAYPEPCDAQAFHKHAIHKDGSTLATIVHALFGNRKAEQSRRKCKEAEYGQAHQHAFCDAHAFHAGYLQS